METPPIDDTAICPACNGSGFNVGDAYCGFCGGCGGVPIGVAEDFDKRCAAIAAATGEAK